jgi:GNAT superfamily N-acetyltransferase
MENPKPGRPDVLIQPVSTGNAEPAVEFLTEWVTDSPAAAQEHLASHAGAAGASLVAVRSEQVIGIVSILWESNYAGFRDRGIPLVHQVSVAGPARRQGVATELLAAAEQLARDRGVTTLGITVGLTDDYGPAQRLYAKLGYLPDGRGACCGREPLAHGTQISLDDEIILWLTKNLARR